MPTINSFIRVLHALPGVSNVDVLINEELLAENLAYTEVSRYLPIGPGNNRIQVFAAGTRTEPILDTQVELPPSEAINLAVTGIMPNPSTVQILQAFPDVPPQEARIRFANLSPDAPGLSLFLNDNSAFGDIGYPEVSDYSSVTPETYNVNLRRASDLDIILAQKNITFQGGMTYTIYGVGLIEGEPALEIIYLTEELPVVQEKPKVPQNDIIQTKPATRKIKITFSYV
ncbi:MAG: DUF4397 domain-containing protein [Syntrophomonadaceae bacterium]|jgi:hypothetical protein